jgi:tetratricopeptide (TPR) repeat protein
MAGVFTNLAYAAAKVGNLREAASLFAQALASARLGGVHLVTMSILLHNYGDVSALLGDYAAAARYHEELVALQHSINEGSEAVDLENLGEIALWTGDAERAVRIFQEALQMLESPISYPGAAELIAHVRGNLAAARGDVARLAGDVSGARRGFEEALTIFEATAMPYNHLARNYEDFVRERLATLTQ